MELPAVATRGAGVSAQETINCLWICIVNDLAQSNYNGWLGVIQLLGHVQEIVRSHSGHIDRNLAVLTFLLRGSLVTLNTDLTNRDSTACGPTKLENEKQDSSRRRAITVGQRGESSPESGDRSEWNRNLDRGPSQASQ